MKLKIYEHLLTLIISQNSPHSWDAFLSLACPEGVGTKSSLPEDFMLVAHKVYNIYRNKKEEK